MRDTEVPSKGGQLSLGVSTTGYPPLGHFSLVHHSHQYSSIHTDTPHGAASRARSQGSISLLFYSWILPFCPNHATSTLSPLIPQTEDCFPRVNVWTPKNALPKDLANCCRQGDNMESIRTPKVPVLGSLVWLQCTFWWSTSKSLT